MIITFKNRPVPVYPGDVRFAKKACRSFLDKTKRLSETMHAPTLYLTIVLTMHVMTSALLNSLNPDEVASMMEQRYKAAKEQAEKKAADPKKDGE